MANRKYKAIQMSPEVVKKLHLFAIAHDRRMCECAEDAVLQYLDRETKPDFRHVEADSDKIGEDA